MHFAYHRENTKEKKSEETEKCLKYGWLWFVIGLRLREEMDGIFKYVYDYRKVGIRFSAIKES